jgi:hypothetical protein
LIGAAVDIIVQREDDERMEALIKELNANFDKFGAPRQISGDRVKMLRATQRRFTRFREEIMKRRVPLLAKHLEKHITVDMKCIYDPESHVEWDLGD